MNKLAKIIIVEKDIPMAARLSLHLHKLGYQITGIFSRAKDALSFIEQEVPDLILLEDRLKGQLNGLESAFSSCSQATVLYFNRDSTEILQNSLSGMLKGRSTLLKKEFSSSLNPFNLKTQNASQAVLKDRIFVRYHDKMVKISLEDIYYIEADRNYCRVFIKNRKFLLVSTLKEVADKLPGRGFLRIHRSYLANISRIDEIGGNHVIIASRSLPLSRTMRPQLLRLLQLI